MAVIHKLAISQFRNFEQQLIQPSTGINLFIGDNAQGKTNLIEAIYYLGHNRSFKTKTIKEVIHHDFSRFQIEAYVDDHKIKLEKSKQQTSIAIDGVVLKNTAELSKKIPIQIITPDRGFLVSGSPKNKRSYLDWGVFHVEPAFATHYKNYRKALKSINVLLHKNQTEALDIWFLELAKFSVLINQARIDYLNKLQQIQTTQALEHLDVLSDWVEDFSYRFVSGWPKEVDCLSVDSIVNYLNNNKTTWLKNKHLSYGIHKASIEFYLKDRDEHYFSRGEQKTLSIIFWLTQVLLLLQSGVQPIVLIDDIASELDQKKIQIILDYLQQLGVQTFITNIDKNIVIQHDKNSSIFYLDNGLITSA